MTTNDPDNITAEGINLTELTKPFPDSAVKSHTIGGSRQARYVDLTTVLHRLNRACKFKWSLLVDRIWNSDDNTMQFALVTLTIPGLGSRQHVGVQMLKGAGGEDVVAKGAVSDAIKKSATLFGVGAELYGPDFESDENLKRQSQEPSRQSRSAHTPAHGNGRVNTAPETPTGTQTNGKKPVDKDLQDAFEGFIKVAYQYDNTLVVTGEDGKKKADLPRAYALFTTVVGYASGFAGNADKSNPAHWRQAAIDVEDYFHSLPAPPNDPAADDYADSLMPNENGYVTGSIGDPIAQPSHLDPAPTGDGKPKGGGRR